MKFCIIGAGVSGICVGYFFKLMNLDFEIIEPSFQMLWCFHFRNIFFFLKILSRKELSLVEHGFGILILELAVMFRFWLFLRSGKS